MKRNERWRKTHAVNKMLNDWRITLSVCNGIQRPMSVITEWAL